MPGKKQTTESCFVKWKFKKKILQSRHGGNWLIAVVWGQGKKKQI